MYVFFCDPDLGFELPRGSSCSGLPDSTGGHLVSESEGHLSSRSVRHSGHGTDHCPWLIVVQPGKTIDLYVIDFALTSRYQVGLCAIPMKFITCSIVLAEIFPTVYRRGPVSLMYLTEAASTRS